MKSPFPGMDPYIEGSANWADFHQSLIVELKRALVRAVPERYIVRGDYRSVIEMVETEGRKDHSFLPDVSVHRKRRRPRTGTETVLAGHSATSAPLALRAFVTEEFRESFVEILDREEGERLVTCVEVLSPSNKASGSTSRDQYLRKRQALLLGSANLVELDLLRGGQRMPMLDPWPDSPYVLMVARVRADHRCDVWPAFSTEPLPAVPFPLREPGPDILIDLQSILDGIYQEFHFERMLDYSRRLSPALSGPEKAVLRAGLKARKA